MAIRQLLHGIRNLDPRYYQIATLASLVCYGAFALDLEIDLLRSLLLVATALLVQWGCTKLWKLPAFDPKSALISSLSLCLLLRTNHMELAVLAAAVTIAGKFVLRMDGRHIFNPTNLGIAVMMLVSDSVWVSPGQWGSAALFALFIACAGALVVRRAARSDITVAFLAFYFLLLISRALWLGDPMVIPLHQMQNGALLIFAFFMISDPKTTPNSRAGRILFAFIVALGAGYIQFRLFRTNGLIWSLFMLSPLVPAINRLLPGQKYEWHTAPALAGSMPGHKIVAASLIVLLLMMPPTSTAFCGFYVAKADASLYNKASQVVLVRSNDHTVLTMANDYQGDLEEFALVVPVPTVLKESDIRIVEKKYIDRVDAFTAPRLVEYFDEDPCQMVLRRERSLMNSPATLTGAPESDSFKNDFGVTIEASYTIGEYDILILSATESSGLEAWLKLNNYRIPRGARAVLGSYIRQNLKFFVAKVNLKEQASTGYTYLRPIQVEYTSPRFMLPIRLGTVNAKGPQDLLIYALTQTGRVETTNYRTVRLPSDMEIPVFVKNEFKDFYLAMFDQQVQKENMKAVFLEYAWDMTWCDPCAAEPLNRDELKALGVFWLDGSNQYSGKSGAQNAYVSRLHVRYDATHFPEDLVFQETGDRQNFQSRFVLRHPWKGKAACDAAKKYETALQQRMEREAQVLANLTGWSVGEVRRKAKAQQ